NRWVDESGHDPNPYHLHVYDWPTIIVQTKAHFIVETAFAQTAGGGFRMGDAPRRLESFDPHASSFPESEWCLLVAMKSPLEQAQVAFDNNKLGVSRVPGWNLNDFAEQYRNPWAVTAIAQSGLLRPWRLQDSRQRVKVAEDSLRKEGEEGPDAAAMLAVIGYNALEDGSPSNVLTAMAERVAHCAAGLKTSPIDIRWRISLNFLKAKLLQAAQRPEEAAEAYRACASIDPMGFGPAIATKTISAHRELGRMRYLRGDVEEARAHWLDGVSTARHILAKADWAAIAADEHAPDAVGLFEYGDVFALAYECALYLQFGRAQASPGVTLFNRTAALTKDGLIRKRDEEIGELLAVNEELRSRLSRARDVLG
ncbi:MAG: hypothetical protein ACRCTI_14280, partial [Beijerinckiaceae bacterium]